MVRGEGGEKDHRGLVTSEKGLPNKQETTSHEVKSRGNVQVRLTWVRLYTKTRDVVLLLRGFFVRNMEYKL